MIKKIKDLLANFSNTEEVEESSSPDKLDQACAALLVEIAFADKIFDSTEKELLKESLLKSYNLEEEVVDGIIDDAENTVAESTSLYEYTRTVNDQFGYENKLNLLENLWKVAYADNNLDKYEEKSFEMGISDRYEHVRGVTSLDLNNDGLVNNSDLEILVSYVIEQSTYGDINQNSKVDIFDVLTISDFLYFY